MSLQNGIKFQSLVEFWEHLPDNERIIVDHLRTIILKSLPLTCKEKMSYNVPYYYGNRRICLIWPAAVPRGGVKSGVLLGFCYGYQLRDPNQYLLHGTNKQVYYKIYHSIDEIEERAIVLLINEAIALDTSFK